MDGRLQVLEGVGVVRTPLRAVNRLRAALAGVNGRLLGLRDQLSPGQRWTAALALGVALSVLMWGLPTEHTNVSGVFGNPSASATPAARSGSGDAAAVSSAGGGGGTALPSASPYATLSAEAVPTSVPPPSLPN